MNTGLLLALSACMPSFVHAARMGGWMRAMGTAPDPSKSDVGPVLSVSVIIPARDAAATLTLLLQDLHAQSHRAQMEVIVVDDHSTDHTAELVGHMAARWPLLRLVRLKDSSGKKAALTAGVAASSNALILFTDADVRCGTERVRRIAHHASQRPWDLLLLPVGTVGHGFLGMLQQQEQAALFGAALGTWSEGAPVLAYGANLAVKRAAFDAVGGYAGDRWAGGDDVFLLHRMRLQGRLVVMVAEPAVAAVVEAEPTWSGFLAQRLRWAGKMRGVKRLSGTLGMGFGLLLPWLLLVFTVLLVREVRIGEGFLFAWSMMLVAWCAWLFPTIAMATQAHQVLHGNASRWRAFVALLAFTVYAPLIALGSLFVRPRWKGRRV